MVFPLTSNLTASKKKANIKKKRDKPSRKSLVIFDHALQLCNGFCCSHFLLITMDNVTLGFLQHCKRGCKSSFTILLTDIT